MTRDDRKQERFKSKFAVRFDKASDFVVEYAENLSMGGLFVKGVQDLEPMTELRITLCLPGLGEIPVVAQVAHIMTEEVATKLGRSPGAGLQLIKTPKGFEDTLVQYLSRLGQRREWTVLANDSATASFCDGAGFTVIPVSMSDVLELTQGDAILAVVTSKSIAKQYREFLTNCERDVPVIGCSVPGDEDALLVELDRIVSKKTR